MSAERVREFYRRQGEERERARASHPSSFNNIAFDTGVIAERQRILKVVANRITSINSNIDKGIYTKKVWQSELDVLHSVLAEIAYLPAEESNE